MASGSPLVIEEFLEGEEASFIVLSDGENVVAFDASQDHKAVFDNDQGPNTGGMGAYSDGRILTASQSEAVLDTVIRPAIEGMRREGTPFTGFLYAGLMMTADGPRVLEFNVRLGDPEAQALLHRLDADLAPVLDAGASPGGLRGATLASKSEPSVCVVLAAAGYPGAPKKGDPITGLDQVENAVVFQAGTEPDLYGIRTAGGRVLGVTASGADLATAIRNAYAEAAKIHFEGMHYRTDIGKKGLKRW
jgi:phosphoribosylamine--glycine ligase